MLMFQFKSISIVLNIKLSLKLNCVIFQNNALESVKVKTVMI